MAKVNLYLDFREFLESLNSAEARYIVLGGYAVNYYGYRRHTDDLDVWISLDRQTLKKVSAILRSFAGFSAAQVKPSKLGEANRVFAFGREPARIDVLTTPSGVEFESCYARCQIVNWDGVDVPLIALEDLRANKISSGRAKDIADIVGLADIKPRDRKKRGRRKD